MKRVIAHKDYAVRGGGEYVAEQLSKVFDCPLYVGKTNPENHPDEMEIHEIAPESRLHYLQRNPGLQRSIGNMLLWRDKAKQHLGKAETVIMSGNEPLWYTPQDHQTIIAYTHSTPRHMYDRHHEREGLVQRTYLHAQKLLYNHQKNYPDLWIANSELVARRLELYWNIPREQIHVVYPPVPTETFNPTAAQTDDFYLYFGRIVGHKRVGELIETFNNRDEKLVVAGKGAKKDELAQRANDNITFTGFVSEQRKRELYAQATATIFPAVNEDFGMVPIESFAAGTPVIGVNEGFTQYQVCDGQNGILYDRGVANLHRVLDAFETTGVEWSDQQIAEFARQNFSTDRFNDKMTTLVESVEQSSEIEPEWTLPKQTVTTDGGSE